MSFFEDHLGTKVAVMVSMSAGTFRADIYVDGFGTCHPRSEAAKEAPIWAKELTELLDYALKHGDVKGIPIQKFLNGRIDVEDNRPEGTLWSVTFPDGEKYYAASYQGETPRIVDFMVEPDLLLPSWYAKTGQTEKVEEMRAKLRARRHK